MESEPTLLGTPYHAGYGLVDEAKHSTEAETTETLGDREGQRGGCSFRTEPEPSTPDNLFEQGKAAFLGYVEIAGEDPAGNGNERPMGVFALTDHDPACLKLLRYPGMFDSASRDLHIILP
jgi:hypothetical protein